MAKKLLLGGFGIIGACIIVAAVIYPEDFAIALVGLLIGLFSGILLATILMESYFQKGANMAHDLQKKQVINPATIMREVRMQEKQDAKQPIQTQQAIPQFNLTGLNDNS